MGLYHVELLARFCSSAAQMMIYKVLLARFYVSGISNGLYNDMKCYSCDYALLEHKCDVIKQNQSEVGNIDFTIQPNKAENFFCFLLFLASFNWSYLWNHSINFNVIFCKM